MKVEREVEKVIEPIINEMGFDLEYTEFVKEGSENIFRVVIDNPREKMWVEDCENVSRAIENVVDNNIDREYVLEVASPGLERQLKNIKLYKKYMEKEIHIKLFKKIDGVKEFNTRILSIDEKEESITVKLDEKEVKLLLTDIADAYTTYDFDSLLKGNTDDVNLNKLNKFNK